MNKNVIIQEAAFNAETHITKKNSDTVEFIAVLQEADRVNRNGRIYPKAVLEKALESPYVRERLATKTFYCEAGHPLDSSVQRQMTIDQRNIACIIEEFWWEGNLLKGRLETANTAVGRDMKGLIEQGSKVAFSLRAQGNVHRNPMSGALEVEPGLQIASFDWVVNPSHDKAFLERICEETVVSLFGSKTPSSQVLTEAADCFINGSMIDCDSEPETVQIDYTKDYTPKLKRVADMYVPEAGDEVVSMTPADTLLKNGNITKKVLTEDFLVKDIRARILANREAAPVLNLSEDWKAEYESFMEEAEADDDNLIENLEEATREIRNGYQIIEEYFQIYNNAVLNEKLVAQGEVGDTVDGNGNVTRAKTSQGKFVTGAAETNRKDSEATFTSALSNSLAGILAKGASDIADKKYGGGKFDYAPEATYTVQSITDMKFPQNIIFFVKQLLSWIKNVVIYFIEKILNLVRRITGVGEEVELNPKSLKLNLQAAKKVETAGAVIRLGGPKVPSPEEARVKAYKVDASQMGMYNPLQLRESIIDDIAFDHGIISKPEMKFKENVVVTVDFSHDLADLAELVQHFYDLYDNAYGSNSEKLFSTDDLETVLRLFKKILDSINDGQSMASYTLGGGAKQASILSADKIRDNLILTNANIKQLKEVFVETSDSISDISKIINSKEMLLLADSGVDYKLLTASTTTQMEHIIKTINPRLKDAAKIEKGLRKMQTEYGKINSKLIQMSSQLRTYGAVSYSSYYERQITELSQAARYMTDIVTLRLTAVALYIQELKSIKSCLEMLTGIQGSKMMKR